MFNLFKKKNEEVVKEENEEKSFDEILEKLKQKYIEENQEMIKELDEQIKNQISYVSGEVVRVKVNNSPEMVVGNFYPASYYFHNMAGSFDHKHGESLYYSLVKLKGPNYNPWTTIKNEAQVVCKYFDLKGQLRVDNFSTNDLVKVKKAKSK